MRVKFSSQKKAPSPVPAPYDFNWEGKVGPAPSLENDIACSYDVIIALDLDCMNEREQPSIKQFANQFIDDVLDNTQVNILINLSLFNPLYLTHF